MISFFNDVFDTDYAMYLYDSSMELLTNGSHVWKTNYSWPKNIINASHPVLIRQVSQSDKFKILSTLYDKGVIEDRNYVVLNYLWTKLSYIPWHDDSHVTDAATVYLNPTWHYDWGGTFNYSFDSHHNIKTFKGIVPSFNMAVKNTEHTPHHVSPISLDAPFPRCTIQLFKDDF